MAQKVTISVDALGGDNAPGVVLEGVAQALEQDIDLSVILCGPAEIVEPFAEKLGLKKRWKPFEDLWGIKNLAQEKWSCQQTGLMPARYQDIDKVFAD